MGINRTTFICPPRTRALVGRANCPFWFGAALFCLCFSFPLDEIEVSVGRCVTNLRVGFREGEMLGNHRFIYHFYWNEIARLCNARAPDWRANCVSDTAEWAAKRTKG